MIVGPQDFPLFGSRVYFQRDPIVLTPGGTPAKQPIVDLGRIDPVSPSATPTRIELKDSDGGVNRTVADAVTDIDESYEVRFSNLNLNNLALLFLGYPPETLTQATGTGTVTHHAHPGSLLKLIDSSNHPIFGLASVVSVGTGLVEGTDWEVVSLERGLVRMIDGGAFAAEADVSVVYTRRAITGLRRIRPQTAPRIRGEALFIWSQADDGVNSRQMARVATVSIIPTAANFDISNYSSATFRFSVINDVTATNPAGTLDYWLGALPAKS